MIKNKRIIKHILNRCPILLRADDILGVDIPPECDPKAINLGFSVWFHTKDGQIFNKFGEETAPPDFNYSWKKGVIQHEQSTTSR